MAAIISEKFRIFNAKQFLESLGEGVNDADTDRTRMYFFVGRSSRWDAYLEIFNVNGTFQVGETVTAGGWSGVVAEVYSNSLLLNTILPTPSTTPAFGSSLGGGTSGAIAKTGTYRYGTEEAPPAPLDNSAEKKSIFDEMIAAKRITSGFARLVVPRYNWNLSLNPKFDMYRPNYSVTPGGGGAIGKQTALGASSLSASKFYVMNSRYEVFKCLYNGEYNSNAGANATYEPTSQPVSGQGTFANGIFTEPSGTAGYIWKHLFTLTTGDVLAFLSSDFMPIGASGEASRLAVEALAVNGSIDTAVVEDAGSNLPLSSTLYTPVYGDGNGAIVKLETDGSGSVTACSIEAEGSGYTYGNVILKTGKVFTDAALTAAVGAFTGTASIEAIISPLGGHGSNAENELFAKRVMTSIRLTYDEGQGDFPVDNDFRRIGIIQDPFVYGSSTFASDSTLRGTRVAKVNGATSSYVADETISQTVGSEVSYGTVVSWDSTNGILKYFQSPSVHTDNGVVRPFVSNGTDAIVGASSTASGTVSNTENGIVSDIQFTGGLASPEIEPNSGEVVYIENRRQITRAPDQIEDIKLVIEF